MMVVCTDIKYHLSPGNIARLVASPRTSVLVYFHIILVNLIVEMIIRQYQSGEIVSTALHSENNYTAYASILNNRAIFGPMTTTFYR